MNRIKDYGKLATDISNWIKQYADSNNIKSLVVGVSGGIDSAVVSTLCAMTGLPTWCVVLPIYQNKEQTDLAVTHIKECVEYVPYMNVGTQITDLSGVYSLFQTTICDIFSTEHAKANTKSRLRMSYLYQMATSVQGIVVGTGNKVEDFGIGFYTKYGDGGVDISPIADLYKTEVRELGRYLGISEDILNAAPTDGLWSDNRTDEQQIGATYKELESVMEGTIDRDTQRGMEVIEIYHKLHTKNQHKMQPIPIYKLPL